MNVINHALVAALILASSAAEADTTAVYAARDRSLRLSMTVEIADNGSVRYQMSAGRTYGLVLSDVDYFVTVDPKGPLVDRVNDLVAAQKEAMAALMPTLRHDAKPAGPKLVPIGVTTINGRTGKAYGYRRGTTPEPGPSLNPNLGTVTSRPATESEVKRASANPVVVISDDPDLAPLGKVMAHQFNKSVAMLSRMMGGAPGMIDEMQAILRTGAPLSFAGLELQSVNHAAIDPKRFELPAQPETLNQIRERLKPLPAPPTATPTKP